MKKRFCLYMILILALCLPGGVAEDGPFDLQALPGEVDVSGERGLTGLEVVLDDDAADEDLDIPLDLDLGIPLDLDGLTIEDLANEEQDTEANAIPKSITLGVKETHALKLSGVKKYSTSNKKVARVTQKGVITAVKVGKATITATSNTGKKTRIKVTVLKAPAAVSVKPSKKTMKVGQTVQLKASLPKKTASWKLTWTSSNKAVATVSSKGIVEAIAPGTATITVKTFNGKKATCKVTVKHPAYKDGPNYIPWGDYAAVSDWSAFSSFTGSQRAPYICCEPDFSGRVSANEFAVDFRADYLPIGTYLCVNNWDFDDHGLLQRYSSVRRDYSGVAGYAGFQRGYDGTTNFILTVWDSYCYDYNNNMIRIQATQVYPENNKGFEACVGDTTTGEGCFVHTLLPFNWEAGKNYRALLQLTNPADGSNSHLLFYICDLQAGAWYRLLEYDLGYNGTCMNRFVSFLEDFSADAHADIRSVALANYRVHPYGSADWTSSREATLSYYYTNNGSYRYGAYGNAFWAVTTAVPNVWAASANYQRFTVTKSSPGSPY